MRKIIKRLILWVSYLLHPNNDSKVIYYHDVSTRYTDMGTDLATIEKHFDVVRSNGYTFVDKITEEKGQIMVCFDDGWAGIYEAKDFFIKQNVYPTIFVAVNLIGKQGYLSMKMIKELQSLGFHFEGHSWSHQDLTTFNEKELMHELKDSKEKLSEMLGSEITSICYPLGRFSRMVYEKSLEAGYTEMYSSLPGGYRIDCEGMALRGRNLLQYANATEVHYMINSISPLYYKRLLGQHLKRNS